MAELTSTHPASMQDDDPNLIAIWTRVDGTRWIAGAMAGFLAGLFAALVAMVIASAGGMEFWFPIKLMATWVLGPSATAIGAHGGAILTGLVIWQLIAVFWGVVFGHFVYTHSMSGLLAMGLVWAAYLWVFNWCLFFQSIAPIFVASVPYGAVFPVCLVYGLSLSTVSFFDRMIRR